MTTRIAVGTVRRPKLKALRAVLEEIDGGRVWETAAFVVESGVRETPLSSEEIRRGARQRVDRLLAASPGFDLYVGMEGGLERSGDGVWLENWAYVSDGARGISEAVGRCRCRRGWWKRSSGREGAWRR